MSDEIGRSLTDLNRTIPIGKTAEASPRLRFWAFSSAYGIASGFFLANFYSFGFSHSYLSVLIPILIFCPFLAAAQISFEASLFRLAALLFGAKCHFSYLQTALSQSKMPYFITLGMWLLFTVQDPDTVFLHVASELSAASIVVLSVVANVWSLILLAQSLREVFSGSIIRSMSIVSAVSLISFITTYSIMFSYKFLSIFVF